MRQRVIALLQSELALEPADLHDELRLREDLALDSLSTVELVMVLEDELDIGLADSEVAGLLTVGDLVAAVTERTTMRTARTLAR